MIRSIRSKAIAFAALALGAMGLTQAAHARTDVFLNIGTPAPVYVQPEPVYVQPRPVYVQPAPVYVQPRPVYTPAPAYVVEERGWRRDDWRRWHRWDHGRHEGWDRRDWDRRDEHGRR